MATTQTPEQEAAPEAKKEKATTPQITQTKMTTHETLQSCSNVIRTMYQQLDTRLAEADPWQPDEGKRIKFQEYTTAIHQLANLLNVKRAKSDTAQH